MRHFHDCAVGQGGAATTCATSCIAAGFDSCQFMGMSTCWSTSKIPSSVCVSEHIIVSGLQEDPPVLDENFFLELDPQEAKRWMISSLNYLDYLLDQVDIYLDQAHEPHHKSGAQQQVCHSASNILSFDRKPKVLHTLEHLLFPLQFEMHRMC